MAVTGTPWFIGQARTEHSAEVARTIPYALSGAGFGITSPTDLRVQALSSPGQGVQYLPGAVVMENRYPGGALQAYVGRKDASGTVMVPPATSGERSDMVIARIYDPQYANGAYAGWDPNNPNAFEFFRVELVQSVPKGATVVPGAAYPHEVLARIDQPAGSSQVTSAMITDLRRKGQSRSRTVMRNYAPKDGDVVASRTQYDFWPRNSTQPFPTLVMPSWANRVFMKVYLSSVWMPAGTNAAGVRGILGRSLVDENHSVIHSTTAGRVTHVHLSSFRVPPEWRGIPVEYAVQAWQTTGSGDIKLDYQTTIGYELFITEEPE